MSTETTVRNSRRVAVVHGQDEEARKGMFAFLRALDLEPIEWSVALGETGSAAPYIGDVLKRIFDDAQAVVVLLTGDDEARLRPELRKSADENQLRPQARANVLFEAGMAFASHERQTLFVEIGELRRFSDIGGLHVVRFDSSFAARQDVMNRLLGAGCRVTSSGSDWHSAGRSELDAALARSRNTPVAAVPPVPSKLVSRAERDSAYDKLTEASKGLLERWTGDPPTYQRWKDASDEAIRVAPEPTLSFLRDRLDPAVRAYAEAADEYYAPGGSSEKGEEAARARVLAERALVAFHKIRVGER